MKNFISKTKTAIILLIVTVLFIGFYAYMIARPISYGMSYHNEVVYEGVPFEGTLKFYPGGMMSIKNTTFTEGLDIYYYYRDGYVFTMTAETAEEYEAEIAWINENFEEALDVPFYAAKINAFRQVGNGLDNDVTTYICAGAIIFAIIGGVILLALTGFTVSSLILSCKEKCKK